LASEKIIGKTILLYGDILFEGDIIKKLIFEASDFAVIVDRSWRDHYHDRVQHTISEAELVEVRGEMISRMGQGVPYDSAHGEFIGIAALSAGGAEKAKALYHELKERPEKNILGAEQLSRSSLTDFFNTLIAKGERIKAVDVYGGWFEIDTFEDYRKSWTIVR
jgi:phosphoenolpyruvate phosphomutase